MNKYFVKIAVVFTAYINVESWDKYNNWLMGGGAVLNFDTSPATIFCGNGNEDEPERHTVMLSDDNGR